MTEQELREEIDNLLCRCAQAYDNAQHKTLLVRAHRDEILALIKEAGYKSLGEVADILSKYLAALKEAGYVKLAEDLSLPELDPNDPSYNSKLEYAGKIIREGWRKVKLEDEDGAKKGD